jgi:hypothetical protein
VYWTILVAMHCTPSAVKKKMIFLSLLLLFVGNVGAALYRQYFDVATVANGTKSTSLSDGACISGSAVVNNSALVLVGQNSAIHVPALSGSMLGWSTSYTARLIGSTSPSYGLWLLWGNAFNVTTNHVFAGLTNNASFSFLAWIIDMYSNGTDAGFFVVDKTGARLGRITETLLPDQEVNASVYIAWNQERGATFRTIGFSTDVNLTDLPMELTGNDSFTWSFATRLIGGFVAIDNIVIDAPCGDCRVGGGECVWHVGGRFECRLPAALQFVQATQTGGHAFSAVALGMDFTVYAAIDVIAIGLLDADDRGISGTLVASIHDRSTDRMVAGPVAVRGGEARAEDANPFVFKTVPAVRLQPGVYSVLSVGFTSDRYINSSEAVAVGNNDAVLITGSVSGGNGSLASAANITSAMRVCGATFRFNVVPAPATTAIATTAAATTATTTTATTTTTAAVSAPTASASTSSTTTSQPTTLASAETMGESTDVALIAGIVGGAVALVALIGVAVAVGLRRRGKSAPSNDLPMAATTSSASSNYGVAPPPRDAPAVRTSEYGPISARGEYASMRADRTDYAAAVHIQGRVVQLWCADASAEGGSK